MPPLIIVSPGINREGIYKLNKNYADRIARAGGAPLIVSHAKDKKVLNRYIELADGVILSGGGDPNPVKFGLEPHSKIRRIEEGRDEFEKKFVKRAVNKNIPVLGICKGLQILNLVLGGSIIQDIGSQKNEAIKHIQKAPRHTVTHTIKPEPGKETLYEEILGAQERFKVNSFHHQAVEEMGAELKVLARSADGIVEMAAGRKGSLLGVQWHPEALPEEHPAGARIFTYFLKQISR